jgi:DNA-binding transcriptional ArsR family regulator
MPTPADELQKVFKTLSDPTRVRILRLLESEPLVVQELMEVLGMAQSRVSRHLAILREVGLLDDRRDGTFVSYRFVQSTKRATLRLGLTQADLTRARTTLPGEASLLALAGGLTDRLADRSFGCSATLHLVRA